MTMTTKQDEDHLSDEEIVKCNACGEEREDALALVVCRRRYEHVCPECMDVLENVLQNQLLGDIERIKTDLAEVSDDV